MANRWKQLALSEVEGLASPRPPTWVRVVLILEVVAYVAAMTWYLCVGLRVKAGVRPMDVFFYAFAAAVPIGLNILHGDWLADSGIRLDNIAPAARDAAVATVIMGALVVAVGAVWDGFHWKGWLHLLERTGRYLGWGPLQQYLLQSFGLRRLRQAGLPAWVAVVSAAGLFGIMHAPNWTLVAISTGAGFVWCAMFLRRPNILTLGIAHGVLAVLLRYAWSDAWTGRLAVGGVYLRYLDKLSR